jgi:hypothetical protein
MAQYAIPDADIVDGTWVDETAGNTNLWNGIAPLVPGTIDSSDDALFIESVANPSNAACAFGLSTIEDPVSSTGHIMRWRRLKDAAGGGTIGLVVALHETYLSEATVGTLINSFTDAALSETVATTTDTLTGGEADTITDYADLQVRFVANQT